MKTRQPTMFRTVLCAVDFSKHSRSALRYAAEIAGRAGGRLVVLFVSDPLLVAASAAAYDKRGLTSTAAAELRQFVERGIGTEGISRTVCLVTSGDPAREIGATARRLGCDLLVLGTRGLGAASRLFFGSTTASVLRHAECPVLAVPPSSRNQIPLGSWPRRVLAGIELGEHAGTDVRRAAAVARWFARPLMLVTVVPPLDAPAWLKSRFGGAQETRGQITSARFRLDALARKLGRASVSVRILAGSPAQQISAAAADTGAGLIVLTLRRADHLFDARQGSVTSRVLSTCGHPHSCAARQSAALNPSVAWEGPKLVYHSGGLDDLGSHEVSARRLGRIPRRLWSFSPLEP